jgi:hypothetical protein
MKRVKEVVGDHPRESISILEDCTELKSKTGRGGGGILWIEEEREGSARE